MRFLIPILCVCFGFVAGNLFEAAAPAIDDAVAAFAEGMDKPGSLRAAVGLPFAEELDEVEEDVKKELKEHIKEALEELLEKIKSRIDRGDEIAKELLEKVRKYKEELKKLGAKVGERSKELLKNIYEKAKDVVKKFLEKLGLGKRNLDQEYDVVARSKFNDFIEKIKAKLLNNETIRKIRDYLKNLATTNPLIREVREFLLRLREPEFREIIREIFQDKRDARSIKEGWEKVKDWFKGLKESLLEKTKQVREWFKQIVDEGFEKLREKYGMIKALALEVIAHGKDLSSELAREAIEFFRPYKEDLATLWPQLIETLKEHIGSF